MMQKLSWVLLPQTQDRVKTHNACSIFLFAERYDMKLTKKDFDK